MTENWIDEISGGLPHDDLADRIFNGRIVIFHGLPPMVGLLGRVLALLDGVFEARPPCRAYADLGQDDYRKRIAAARRLFRQNEDIGRLYKSALIAAGCDPETTYADKFTLRNSPPFNTAYAPGFGALPPHRDSWGSGLDCQINWWMPFFDLTPGRTMALFPDFWDRPVANDSGGWDWRRARTEPDYPALPTAREAPDWGRAVPLMLPPGALAAFSGAHLHASIPNNTDEARISSDTRTIDMKHLREGRGAPNIDRAHVPPGLDWFHHIKSGGRLSDAAGSAGGAL